VSRGNRESDAVRSAIRELRSFDERTLPSFDAVLARRPARRPARRRVAGLLPPLAIAAGVAIGVASAVVHRGASRSERFTVPREVRALSSWRPMTDVLLETPNRRLLREAPRLGASLIQTHNLGDSR
jgi:hypothetical protein